MNNFSSEKKVISCQHFGPCSGCVRDTVMLPPLVLYTRARNFFHEISQGFIIPECIFGESIHWRTRAKLVCRLYNGKPRFGLYKKNSHDLIPIPHCQVHHPSINRAVFLLEETLSQLKDIRVPYDEIRGSGLIRYVQCSVERKTSRVQLAVVMNAMPESSSNLEKIVVEALEKMVHLHSDLFHSLWINYNPQKTNRIYGDVWKHLLGPEEIWETILGVEIPILPSHFEQANLPLFEKVIEDIALYVGQDSSLVELYAGMGVISLVLGKNNFKKQYIIELHPDSKKSFDKAVAHFPESFEKKCQFIIGDSEEVYLREYRTFGSHILLLDPPRKGLSPGLLQFLSSEKAIDQIEQIVYISCHYPTLERDIEALLKLGLWRISFVRCYLFFPGTEHIETVVILSHRTN